MTEIFSPFVFWAQTEHQVSLRVDLKDVKKEKVSMDEDKLEFFAEGKGARGLQQYSFFLKFYSKLEPEVSMEESLILFLHCDSSVT